jgi:hypothetical protein
LQSLKERAIADAMHTVKVVESGHLACLALRRSGGIANPVAGFEDAPYAEACGEILWVGPRLPGMHPRAVITASPVPRGATIRFEGVPERGWSGRLPRLTAAMRARVGAAGRALFEDIASSPPKGFGAWLAGQPLSFPLTLAAPRLHVLAQAFADDDAEAAFEASAGLLGFGTGLTPSGDDLVGGALFGRRWIALEEVRWRNVGQRLTDLVAERSHRLSAALFGDLARGESFSQLHDVAAALAADQRAAALAAARELVNVGHSSGWDMLAGFVIGVSGSRKGLAPGGSIR